MSEIREKLKPYVNKRVKVRGTFTKWDSHWKTGIRQTGRACVTSPEIDAEVVCQHVWVVDAPHWKEYQKASGSQVVFDAVVQEYTDRSTGKTNYHLESASDPTFLHQPPALTIPEQPKEVQTVRVALEASAPAESPTEATFPSSDNSPMEKTRQVKLFAKACGNFDKAEKVLAVLPPMPLPELLDYLKALKE